MIRETNLIGAEYELFPERYRWSVRECHQLALEGKLVGRYEVLDGEVVKKVGQKPAHRMTIMLVMKWLLSLFDSLQVQTEGPIELLSPDNQYSEPEPDIVVTSEPTTAYRDRHPNANDILLVVEVSDTTLRTDLLVKARLYARARILEYWAVDPVGRQIHIHRDPVDGAFNAISVHSDQDFVALAVSPEAKTSVGALLPIQD